MTELHEKDAMVCRACGNEERASEGYPCSICGTFLCVICNLRGVITCAKCAKSTKEEIAMPEWLLE
ncbi:MAG: hypothetical protein JWM95_4726 [Gemmatimonadetes bacterium]|nr:hypothetical protein [Gemmatimonadota bacterium]